MKKNSIIAMALLSLGLFACTKPIQEVEVIPEQNPEEEAPEVVVTPVEMAFTATIAEKVATKSVDADGIATWEVGEKIAVYYQKKDLSYATATANVDAVDAGVATISATLTDAKNATEVKFVYPATLMNAETGDLNPAGLATQHGTIADISANFDACTGSATLETDGTTCGTSENVHMTNQVLIGKFTPKYNKAAIADLVSLTIWDGTHTYTVTPSEGTFGTDGIYVAMLPVANKRIVISANTSTAYYHYDKSGITLAVGKLYNNLAVTMTPVTHITNSSNALQTAVAEASTGAIIEMAAGTYVEANDGYYIDFAGGKEITVLAMAGATVTLQQKLPIKISGGAKAIFVDIVFDASHLTDTVDWYEHLIQAGDDNSNNRLELDNCEIKDFDIYKAAIACRSGNKIASVRINNCYFHDIYQCVFFLEDTSNTTSFEMTNSTVANITVYAGGFSVGVIDLRGTSPEVSIDHCTFYNCQVRSTDYGTIRTASAKTTVSNCIFMMPESTGSLRTIHAQSGSKAQYCMVYNYTYDSGYGMRSDVAKTGCTNDKNPLFVDAASGDFTLGATSPARTASSTGGPIGDPRWY